MWRGSWVGESPSLSVSCELWGNKRAFPMQDFLSKSLHFKYCNWVLFFRSDEYGSNVCQDAGPFHQDGCWDLQCGDFRMVIRLIYGGGYSVGRGVLILTPQWNIHPRTWSALFTWMSSILTFSRQYKSYPGNVLTFQPWEVIWNCSFHLTEQLSFFCASFKGLLCQSTFSSYPQKRGSFIIKGPSIKIGYQVDMMLILFVLAILVFSHTWR